MKGVLKNIGRIALKCIGVFIVLSFMWVLVYKYANPPITGMMFYKWVKQENYTIDFDWISIDEIATSLPMAFIASEDQKFLEHNGFDVAAIKKAMETNKSSENKRGASTISQQVAKNVFLLPTRNYLRKGLEVYFTALIELIWGKKRIMEVYLNIVELGEGVYGVEPACRKYFNSSCSKITKSQAALVAVSLPNPLKMELSKPSAYMRTRSNWVLKQMNNLGGEGILSDWYE